MRDESFNTKLTLCERPDTHGTWGLLSGIGVFALNDYSKTSRFNSRFPGFWGGIGLSGIIGDLVDPCQFPISADGKTRKVRKPVSLVTAQPPISMEPGDKCFLPLTAKADRDDLIHVNDGSYISPVANYICCGLS